eukprot:CAMPEP_0177785648 /NCGR_PEP_ID=MMETSP0491_2-20121128/20463_1 /TAXON_ID=63592 /ORGANISM="Tetraselmis chuii, Strain PLY429" /LENGTH=292 /DNA_ID=CAMNT_0019306729 /DNA_START=119 /DNA_END=997 /DNA_ORIENTATION=-
MALPLEEAMRTLEQMMPGLDREVILSVLESHGGNMERTVESLLGMAGEHDPTATASTALTSGEDMAGPPVQAGASSRFAMEPDDAVVEQQAAGSSHRGNVPSALMEMDEMIARTLQQEEFLTAVEQDSAMRLHPRQGFQMTPPVSSSLGDAVQGVSDTITSIGSAAYNGLSSLVSGFSAFSSCMPTPAANQSNPWERDPTSAGLWSPPRGGPAGSISSSPPPDLVMQQRHTRRGEEEPSVGGGEAVGLDMPGNSHPVADETHPALPSVSRLVHRRGHHGDSPSRGGGRSKDD